VPKIIDRSKQHWQLLDNPYYNLNRMVMGMGKDFL